ncbi:ThiF family adenylyltransferase [Pedobacter sp. BMA]|uniref:ThiF family adenylyltransferase n=1 Tax=Pedobacter sp. BMA TaxID=1663685 RepID=UPI000649FFC2|nr:ThiF family adenylyltransferase [Pedobacter sp. BMA]KLT64335.1 molybdopterin biosynthesis protein [Pedobacter sp. BMA]
MDTERYQRQLILSGFGPEAQQLLLQAKVLVIGAGGLGCPALQYLAAAGVGYIGIADNDTIELSNLHRQVLFGTANIGSKKASVAAKRLQEMNPDPQYRIHLLRISTQNIAEVFRDYDIIFDGTDNFDSRYLINDTCVRLHKSLVFAAVSGFEGQLAIFNVPDADGRKTNYRDIFPVPPAHGEIPNCAENGILGVLPGIMGTMAAGEIIKLITGIGKPLINKLLHYNLLSQEQYEMNISPSKYDTPLVMEASDPDTMPLNHSYIEIDVERMLSLSEEESTIIIDVREKHEFPRLDTETYKQVPMSAFDNFLSSEITQNNIVLLCQHGVRSVAAAEALYQKYGHTKTMYSLKGGIAKWRKHFLTT